MEEWTETYSVTSFTDGIRRYKPEKVSDFRNGKRHDNRFFSTAYRKEHRPPKLLF